MAAVADKGSGLGVTATQLNSAGDTRLGSESLNGGCKIDLLDQMRNEGSTPTAVVNKLATGELKSSKVGTERDRELSTVPDKVIEVETNQETSPAGIAAKALFIAMNNKGAIALTTLAGAALASAAGTALNFGSGSLEGVLSSGTLVALSGIMAFAAAAAWAGGAFTPAQAEKKRADKIEREKKDAEDFQEAKRLFSSENISLTDFRAGTDRIERFMERLDSDFKKASLMWRNALVSLPTAEVFQHEKRRYLSLLTMAGIPQDGVIQVNDHLDILRGQMEEARRRDSAA